MPTAGIRAIETITRCSTSPAGRQHGLRLLLGAQQAQDEQYLASHGVLPLLDALVSHMCRASLQSREHGSAGNSSGTNRACSATASTANVDVLSELELGARRYQWRLHNAQLVADVQGLVNHISGPGKVASFALETTTRAVAAQLAASVAQWRQEFDRLDALVPPFMRCDTFFSRDRLDDALRELGVFAQLVVELLSFDELCVAQLWPAVACHAMGDNAQTLIARIVRLPPELRALSPAVRSSLASLQRVAHRLPLIAFLQSPRATPSVWHAMLRLPQEEFPHKIVAAVKAQNTTAWSLSRLLTVLDDPGAETALARAVAEVTHAETKATEEKAGASGPSTSGASTKKAPAEKGGDDGRDGDKKRAAKTTKK